MDLRITADLDVLQDADGWILREKINAWLEGMGCKKINIILAIDEETYRGQ